MYLYKKPGLCIRAGENNLLLSGLVYGFRDPAHLRDSKLLVGFTDNQLINAAIQSFTNQIQIVKTDSFCKVVIQFIDGLSADAGCAGKFRLRHAPFAETR